MKFILEDVTKNLTEIDINKMLLIDNDLYEYLFQRSFKMPPFELSKIIRFDDIVGVWKYPFNSNSHLNEIFILFVRECIRNGIMQSSEMVKLFNIYKNLNPELEDLINIEISSSNTSDNLLDVLLNIKTVNMFHIMMGMTSGFNYDDIADFISLGGHSCRSLTYKTRKHELITILNYDIQYVPSEKTIDKIYNYINNA